MNVVSGPAFVPRARTPTCGATKSALHSWTQSPRFQFRDAPVQVVEQAPPLVATDLTPEQQDQPQAVPPGGFIKESRASLAAEGTDPEIPMDRVKPQRDAAARGDYGKLFAMINGG